MYTRIFVLWNCALSVAWHTAIRRQLAIPSSSPSGGRVSISLGGITPMSSCDACVAGRFWSGALSAGPCVWCACKFCPVTLWFRKDWRDCWKFSFPASILFRWDSLDESCTVEFQLLTSPSWQAKIEQFTLYITSCWCKAIAIAASTQRKTKRILEVIVKCHSIHTSARLLFLSPGQTESQVDASW